MINNDEFKKYSATYSEERIASFLYSKNETFKEVATHYIDNIKISQSIYPELCTLEVILRNAIDDALKTHISKTWIEDEINNNVLLDEYDYQTLLKAYNETKKDCKSVSKEFTIGKVVANLNFGFWTNICGKKYNAKIWNKPKCFYSVFVKYPYKRSINNISKKLYTIRRFRNRVFHYEKIFKYPNRTLNMYNDILEILSYLPNDQFEVLKKASTFLDTYNLLTQTINQK
jgi:hypothetical protein